MDRMTLTKSAMAYVRQIADMAGEVKDDRMLIYATGQIRGIMDAMLAMKSIAARPKEYQKGGGREWPA